MLATFLHMLQGTPYVYQGDELGMTNAHWENLSEVRDVEIFNAYRLHVEQRKAISHGEMMACVDARGRDNARTPMQWNAGKGAGFTQAKPWIKINPNYTEINAESQVYDPDSIYSYYKRLIRLRREYEIIIDGEYTLLDADNPDVYTFTRTAGGQTLLVLCNFSASEQSSAHIAGLFAGSSCTRIIGNYEPETNGAQPLRPYEARVYLIG